MAFPGALITLCFAFICTTSAEIPSYMKVCKKNDPNLSQCILNSVEALRPKLKTGIPELDVPALEPLVLRDVVSRHGYGALKIQGSNFVIQGASNYQIHNFTVDLPALLFNVDLSFPTMTLNAVYDVNGKFLNFNLQSKGPVKINANDITGKVVIKGKKVKRNGNTHFAIDTMSMKLSLKKYTVKLGNGFFKDPTLTEAVNVAINENGEDILRIIMPRVESLVKSVLMDIANNITSHFLFDELFPEK